MKNFETYLDKIRRTFKNDRRGRTMLIIIEGTDGSGKETQTIKLCKRLEAEGKKVKRISFPNYDSDASAPVKMYLAGKFGTDANSVNPYAASTMYAIDRFASFKEDWEKDYKEGTIIIADRYTTSNMLHQSSKFVSEFERKNYVTWLKNLEYKKMNLPEPDLVFFLNMPPECSEKLRAERMNKITGEEKKDIHEGNKQYMQRTYDLGCVLAFEESWQEINCTTKEKIKTIDEINEELYSQLKNLI